MHEVRKRHGNYFYSLEAEVYLALLSDKKRGTFSSLKSVHAMPEFKKDDTDEIEMEQGLESKANTAPI